MTFDFQAMIARDQENIFMNANEFARLHDLNGTTCKAVVQAPTSREQLTRPSQAFGEIPGRSLVVFVRREYLPEAPLKGNRFDVDGEIFVVQSCEDAMGMLKIVLGADGL